MNAALIPTCLQSIGVLTMTVVLALPTMASADQIWVAPVKAGGNGKVGNWGTANLGGFLSYAKETHLSFRVPDNFDTFTKAVVVLLPPKTANVPFTAKISVSGDGLQQDDFTDSFSGTAWSSKNQITELDVSTIFPGFLGPTHYVSVNFELNGLFDQTRVVGMWFEFVSKIVTVSTGNIEDDSITVEKVADAAVDSRKLAREAVLSEKLANEAVVREKIAREAVVREKIALEAVDSTRIAAQAVEAEKIRDGAVLRDKLADNAVGSAKIAAKAVEAEKIADRAVISEKLADQAVNTEKLAVDAVVAEKIKDGAVERDKIADNAIGPAKIADGAVTAAELAPNAVDSLRIADNAITAADIKDGEVTAAEIRDGTVGVAELADNSVSSSKIAADAVGSSALKGNVKAKDPCPKSGTSNQTIISVQCACDPTEVGWTGRCRHDATGEAEPPTLQSAGLFYKTDMNGNAWTWECVWSKPAEATYVFTAEVICME